MATETFEVGDEIVATLYRSGGGRPQWLCDVRCVVLSVGIEICAMVHPAEDFDELRELFASEGLDLEGLKSGPVYLLDCLQPEACVVVRSVRR